MSFIKPGQVMSVERVSESVSKGYMLTFHPNFVQSSALAIKLNGYDFFAYAVREALFLSDQGCIVETNYLRNRRTTHR